MPIFIVFPYFGVACGASVIGRNRVPVRLLRLDIVATKILLSAKVPIVDELRGVWLQRPCRKFGEQRVPLYISMGSQPGGDAVQVAIAVTGMTTEFESSLCRQRMEKLT